MSTPQHPTDGELALDMPLDGMQLIEASAGTGKTFTIAGLYTRLIVERRLPVRQLLVMTFTRAATEELRQRLRQRLVLCAQLADSPMADPQAPAVEETDASRRWALALLRRARAGGDESPQALAQRLRAAALGMDEAAIFTIHGFCQRVLGEYAALIDDAAHGTELVPNDRDLLQDFAADFWLRVAGSGDAVQLQALQQLAPTPQALAQALGPLVPFGGTLEPAADETAASLSSVNAADDRDQAWQSLLAAWQADATAATAMFRQWLDGGHLKANIYPSGCERHLAALAAALAEEQDPRAHALRRFAQARIAGAVKKHCPPFPGHAAFAAIDTWLEADDAAADRCRALQPVLLRRALDEARTWLARRKRALSRLSYDDQISRLADGLAAGPRSARLAAALRTQYPCALVDEFQDTDARQFGILDTLYRGHGSLFMIGDPKQAIYGFRGGDVHAYLRAAHQVDARARHHLARNFRSSAGMLRAVEAVFTARDDAFIEPGIAFESVQWGGRTADHALCIDATPVPPLTLWPRPRDLKGKPALVGATREAMTAACASTVVRLLAHGTLHGAPLAPAQVAVLTNTNAEAATVQDALHRRGVAAVCVRQESVYASREAVELLRLLDALLVPQSMRLARGALASELLGRTLADLQRMDNDEAAWREALQELATLHECWFARGVQAMLESLAERHAPRLLALADGERRLGNLLQLGEALQVDGRRLAGERALRDRLAQRIRDADRANEEEQLHLESDADRVQIVTLHRSKGLEYDVVLMPFAALLKAEPPKCGQLATFHRGDDAVKRLILSDSGSRKEGAAAQAQADRDACDAATRERLAERVRLLYVGITRARHACWMGSGSGGVLDHLLGDDADGRALAAAHADVIACQPPPAHAERMPAAPSPGPGPGARTFARDLPRDWWVHSFSQLAEGTRDGAVVAGGASDEPAAAGDPAVPSASSAIEVPGWPRGARYGNAVHAILEQVDFAAWRERTDAPSGAAPLLERELRAAGYGGEELGVAEATTARLVAAALNDHLLPGLRLADVAPTARRAEMEFHFGIAGATPAALLALLQQHGYQAQRRDFARLRGSLRGMMNGIIDLVFVHDNQWWIVDYKTNYLGPRLDDYAPARLPAAIAAHDYDLQYLIYTVAVHRWLRLSLGPDWDYGRDFGGVRYLFLRGMSGGMADVGIFADKPPQALVEALDTLLRAPMGEVA